MQTDTARLFSPLHQLTQSNLQLFFEFARSDEVAREVRKNVSSAVQQATQSAMRLACGPAFMRLAQGSARNWLQFMFDSAAVLNRGPLRTQWLLDHEASDAPTRAAWP